MPLGPLTDDYMELVGEAHARIQQRAACTAGEHDIRKSATKCGACGKELCELCGADDHSASGGHDLSNPMYWGV